jgi:hypothetical protein
VTAKLETTSLSIGEQAASRALALPGEGAATPGEAGRRP